MFSFISLFYRLFNALRLSLRDSKFRGALLFVVILLSTGTVFYHQIEGWSLLDSLYFCVTTLATVGSGDLSPTTDLGKVFTILYIFIGVGTILSFITHMAQHAHSQDDLNKLWQLLKQGRDSFSSNSKGATNNASKPLEEDVQA